MHPPPPPLRPGHETAKKGPASKGASSMAQFDCLEKPLSIFFYRHGRLVARHPLPFLIFPVLFTAALSLGFLHTNSITDATYLFTPTNAPSKRERQIIHEKWPVQTDNFIPGRAVTQAREIQVIAHARNDENILETTYTEAVHRLNLYLMNKVAIKYKGREYYFNDLCLGFRDQGCFRNEQITLLSRLWNAGAELWKGEDKRDYLLKGKAWFLIYQLKFQNDTDNFLSGLFEREVEQVLLRYTDPFIKLTFFHSQTLTEELKRNADALTPKFVIAFTILIIFCVSCSFKFLPGRFLTVDWVLSKPLLALAGVLSAGMGVAAAVGLLNFTGFYFNEIVLVMPFLAVSIGIDNMFLMIAAVGRTSRSLKVEERIAESLCESAISISITALTDALSFSVGAITSIPAVQIFCVYTAVAIVITFIFQLTFFLALMVLHTKAEEKGLHCIFGVKTLNPKQAEELSVTSRLLKMGTQPPTPLGPNSKRRTAEVRQQDLAERFFADWFSPILMHPIMRILVLAWLLIYLAFGIWGWTLLKEGLEPINLLVRNSYAIPHYHNLEKYFWSYGMQVQIVVNNAPDLSDAGEREKMRSVIRAFTDTPHTLGYDAREFWLDELELWALDQLHYPPDLLQGHGSFYGIVCRFLDTNTYARWNEDVYWWNRTTNGNPCNDTRNYIQSFRLILALKNFERTNSQRDTTALLREIAARYPQYNITTFMPLWLFTDQYALILPNTLQNIGIALACMVFIAILLIPQPVTALCVAVAIISIDVGVVGYMTLWGVNLDAISMITLIMSIGFSVDFSAHICYGYVVSEEEQASERVRQALGELGWPICQGAFSTILGVLVLSSVDAYMIVTFFKTVFLVILIGAIHGLIFLPVMLSLLMRGSCLRVGSGRKKPGAVHPISPSPVFHLDGPHSSHLAPPQHSSVEGGSPLNRHASIAYHHHHPPPPFLAVSSPNPILNPAASTPNHGSASTLAPPSATNPSPFGYIVHHRRWNDSP